jgi:GT2 family glycosyltransferase
LLKSTVPVTIVVVDSTPNDPELAPAIQSAPDVVLLRSPDNRGFGRSNNLGIEWALANTTCEYFFLLNNDTVIYPDSIEILKRVMDDNPELSILTPRIAYFDHPNRLWYGGGEVDWRRASAFTPDFDGNAEGALAMTERDVSFATGCAMMLRRSSLQKLGGFDPRFFMYEEDVELSLRATKAGMRIRYVPGALILHRVQGSSGVDAGAREPFWSVRNPRLPFFAYHVFRNRLLVASLHAKGLNRVTVLLFFPLFMLRRMIPWMLGGRMDAITAMLKGAWDGLRISRRAPVKEAAV